MRFIPRWRKATWAIAIWTVLMAVWIVAGVTSTNVCTGKTGDALSACQAGAAIGGGLAVSMLVALWFVGFIVLAIVWFMSRPSGRTCPVCGENVKKGLTACRKCGYDFAAAARSNLSVG